MPPEAEIDITADLSSGDFDAGSTSHVATPAGAQPHHGTDTVHANAVDRPTDTQRKPDKGLSLRDQLSTAFKGETAPDAAAAAAQAAVDRGDGRTPTGQFAPKAGEPGSEQQGQQPAAVQAPQGFDPALFASLPAETQQHVAQTMAGVEEQAARYRGYEGLEAVIGPRRQAWAMNGTSEAQAVNQLLAISDFATQSPTDFIGWFAGQHGIDLAQVAEGSADPDQYIDPAVQELQQQVERLNGTITQMTQGQATAQHQSLVDFTAQFATEVGTDNAPLRPYFGELGNSIVPYIQQVKAENPSASHKEVLSEAYDRACWATPSVRTKLLAAQEAKRLSEQSGRAARAQQASSSVTGDAPGTNAQKPADIGSGSVRDTLRAAIQQHSV